MASIKGTVSIDLSRGATAEELRAFLDLIPPHAALQTDVHCIPADRPGEQESYRISLTGEWSHV